MLLFLPRKPHLETGSMKVDHLDPIRQILYEDLHVLRFASLKWSPQTCVHSCSPSGILGIIAESQRSNLIIVAVSQRSILGSVAVGHRSILGHVA